MASLETLYARREALDAAIASGVLTVRHGETSTTFHSMSDLLKARAHVQAQIDALESGSISRPRRTVAAFGNGS